MSREFAAASAIACCLLGGHIHRTRLMAERIPATDVTRATFVRIRVGSALVDAVEGETLAAALLAAGHAVFRRSPRAGEPRGPLCFMGVCQECVVLVGGVRQPACQVAVREGMAVELAI